MTKIRLKCDKCKVLVDTSWCTGFGGWFCEACFPSIDAHRQKLQQVLDADCACAQDDACGRCYQILDIMDSVGKQLLGG